MVPKEATKHSSLKTEAKYAANVTTACRVVWLRRILTDLKQEEKEATVIFCDNKSTIALSKNPISKGERSMLN